jgi:hypothetical protein
MRKGSRKMSWQGKGERASKRRGRVSRRMWTGWWRDAKRDKGVAKAALQRRRQLKKKSSRTWRTGIIHPSRYCK